MAKTFKQILKETNTSYGGYANKKKKSYDEILKSNYDFTDTKKDLESSIRLDTFENDLKSVGTTVDDIYKGWQPQETMTNTRSTVESMKERVNAFQEYQKLFGGEDAIDVSDLANSYNAVLKDWDSLSETYGKYKDADSFNAYKTNTLKSLEEHEGEIKTLDEQIAHLKAEKDKFDNDYKASGGYLPSSSNYNRPGFSEVEPYKAWQTKSSDYERQIKELENKKAEQQLFYDDKKAFKEQEELNKKHAEMAQSQEGITGFEKYLADEEASKSKDGSSFGDIVSRAFITTGQDPMGTAINTAYYDYQNDDSYKKPTEEWNEEQNHIFGAYYLTDPEKAYEYAIGVNNQIAEKKANKEKAGVVDSATDNFWSGALHTAGAIATAPLGLTDYVDNLIETSARGTITQKPSLTPFDYSQAVTEGISTELNENYGTLNENIPIIGGKGWGDVYGLGTSIAQSAVSAKTLGSVGTLVSYFGQGAAAGVDDALSRGASEEQAILYGTILGAAEGISENIGAEKLLKLGSANEIRKILLKGFKNGGTKEFFKLLNKQGWSEALEETFSSFVGQVADNFVLQDKSNFNAMVKEYMANGMSKDDATKAAWVKSVEGIAYDTLGGYISGGVHAGPQIGVAAIKTNAENKSQGQTIRDNERIADVLNIASMTPQESDTYKAYTEYANRGINAENITDAQLGNLYGIAEDDAVSLALSKKATKEQKADAETTYNRLSKMNTKNKAVEVAKTLSKNEVEESPESTLSEREMVINDLANGMKEESEAKANLFRMVDDGRSNAGDYADSFNLVVALSQNDYSQDYILEHRGVLSTTQVDSIYKSVVTNPKMAQQKRLNALIQEQGDNLEIKGTIDDSVIDYDNTGAKGKINWKDIHPNVKSTIAYISGLSTKVAGMDVQLVTNGRDYGFTGQYDRQGNTMFIDITALVERVESADTKGRKDNSHFIISTVAHEVTHWMEEKAPELYAQYDKMVMDALTSGRMNEADVIGRRLTLLQIAENKRAEKENRKPREITEKEARREVIARASEDMLAMSEEGKKFFESLTENEQKQFVDKIKEVLQNIKEWINNVLSKLTSSAPEAQDLRALAKDLDAISKKWDEMLRQSAKSNAAMKKVGVNDKAIMESKVDIDTENSDIDYVTPQEQFQIDYENAVDKILASKNHGITGGVVIGRTPLSLTKIGINQLPLTITPAHIYSIAKTKAEAMAEGRYDSNLNYHGLGANAVKQIGKKLSNPIMVLQHHEFTQEQQKNSASTHKVIAVVEFVVNGKRVIAPIEIDAEVKLGNKRYDSNHVATYFDKNSMKEILQEAIAKENIGEIGFFYLDKKRAMQIFKSEGTNYPTALNTHNSNVIIRDIGLKVNKKISNFTQSQQFIRWFGDWQNNPQKASKVVNADGTPKIMYHGSPENFSIFDRKKSKPGSYGRGFYFTDSVSHGGQYGNTRAFYLDIKNPLDTSSNAHRITKKQLRAFLNEVAQNEDYGIENYGEYTTVDSLMKSFEGKSDFDVLQDINATCIGDFVAAIELFNQINGTKYDGIITPTETVTFSATQQKSATDNRGTYDKNNPDVYYSDIDADGDELSEEQIEFFKNSKVRNSNGALIPVYHGTVADFTIFDRDFGNSEGDFGRGFYFTNTPEDVENNYANEEGPDLVNKIEHWADMHDDEFESHEDAVEAAREKYITAEPRTIKAYLNMTNPVELFNREDGTYLDYEESYDEEYDEYGEPEGLLIDFVEALQNNESNFDVWRSPDYWSILGDRIYDGGLYLVDAIQMLKNNIFEDIQDEDGNLALNELIRMALEDMGYDGIIDHTVSHKFRNMKGMTPATTHYIVFNSEQAKRTDNLNPTNDPDIRYSDIDSEGNELSKEQQDFFAYSKVRDSEGNLLVCYHGTNAKFTTFDADFISQDNKLGFGFYFMAGKELQYSYKNPLKTYLNITNPITDTSKKLTKNTLMEFCNKLGIELDYESEDFDLDVYERLSYAYSGETKTFLQNVVSILGVDGVLSENRNVAVAFSPEQIKETTNKNPTNNPDIRYSDIDEEVTVYDLAGENKRLQKENEKLLEDFKRLKERLDLERKVTGGTTFNSNQLDAVAGHIRKLANSNYSKEELVKQLNNVYTYIATSKELTWEDLFARLYGVSQNILKESRPYKVAEDDYFKTVLEEIRTQKISLSDVQKQELESAYGKSWNRVVFGKLNVSNDATMSLDSQWSVWSNDYPGLFDAETTEGDQIIRLLEIYDDVRDGSETFDNLNNEDMRRWLANEIYNQYWNVSIFKSTADKYDRKIKLLNFDHRKAMKELRDNYEERLAKQKQADKSKYNEIIKNIRQRKEKEIQEVRKLGKERMDKYRENAKRKTLMQSILSTTTSLNKKLLTNSKETHIPEPLKPVVINLIASLDFSSKQWLGMRGGRYKWTPTQKDIALDEAFSKVKAMADENVSLKDAVWEASKMFTEGNKIFSTLEVANDLSLAMLDLDLADKIVGVEGKDGLLKSIDALEKKFGDNGFVLENMSIDDLNTLNAMVKSINHWATQVDKALAITHKEGIANLGMQTIEENDALGEYVERGETAEGFKKFFSWSNLLPVNAFGRMGTAAQKVFEALQNAQDKLVFLQDEVERFTAELFRGKEKEIKKWREDVRTFDLDMPNGKKKTVRMPVSYMMSLYAVAKQEDATRHLLGVDQEGNKLDGGGFTIKGFKHKGRTESDRKNTVLTKELIAKITGELSEDQKHIADELQKFMNEKGSSWGDSVSMALYGIKKFGIENYFPITVTPTSIKKLNTDKNNTTNFFSILNYGFTKSRNPNATQSIEIGDIFDVFTNHMTMMAIYNAYALPVYDMVRWYNYHTKTIEGEEVGVIKSLQNAFGEGATSYIEKLITDLNGQHESSRLGFISRIFKNTKIAMVGNSLSVSALQITAYPKAALIISPKYLMKSLFYIKDFGVKKGREKAKKYSGIALWKSKGNFDVDISRNMSKRIKHEETLRDKLIEWSLKGAEKGDEFTWGMLWNACEFEIRDTRKDLKVGSDEFHEAVAKRLREIVYKTQVVDSPLTRSEVMRSPDGMAKSLTMFASELTVAYNIVSESFVEAHLDVRKNGKKGSLKRNGGKIARALTIYTVTSAFSQILATAIQAYRDDEEEKEFEDYLKMYLSNFLLDWAIIGKLPYIKEALNYAQGYSSSRVETVWMDSFFKAARYWEKAFSGKEGASRKAIEESLKTISYLSGIAGYNQYRDLMATLGFLGILTKEEFEELLDEIFE